MPKPLTIPAQAPIEKAFLVGVELKRPRNEFPIEDSLDELERLAETAGLQVIGRVVQHVERINPATFIGKGKLNEIIATRADAPFDVLLFDEELHPNQQREIEQAFEGADIKVLDRTALILDIFAQHARTKEGALQVELAQYEYRLPRLTRMWTHLARQAGGAAGRGGTGGVGLRGPGERQLELDRREIRTRISHLKKQIEEVRTHRREYRRKRKKEGAPTVAIVGYTNAGKSTLLNALSGADILTEDKLFATLDPTTRRVKLPGGSEALFTDTVGFIQKLPTELVAAFRATLEEITEADVLLHVLDASHANARDQAHAVEETLEEIGAGDKPMVIALNKMDRILLPNPPLGKGRDWVGSVTQDESVRFAQDMFLREGNAVRISALKGQGLDELLALVERALAEEMIQLRVRIPYNQGELVALFHQRGIIEREEFTPRGTVIVGKIAARLVERFEEYRI
ncbi:MAG: GTPase HflX [Chloroflexi bacterium]|nr:GTPase HflX [Chloroflexota bacterium]